MIDPNATDASDGVATPATPERSDGAPVDLRDDQVATAAITAIAAVAASEAGTPGDRGLALGAGGYARWRVSEERANARENRVRCLGMGVVALAIALTIAATAVSRSAGGTYRLHAVPLAGAAALGALGGFLVLYSWIHYASVKNDFLDDYRRERIYEAIDGIEPPDVRQLIILNQRRMDQYHQMTLAQAADAWRSSQLAMTAGLVVLVAGITVALADSTGTASTVVIGALTGIGSALSGYVAGTFLRARRQSLRQLNFYFHQPLATSYLLTAERITEKIPDPHAKVEVWKILAGQIAMRAFDAQSDPAPVPAPPDHDHHK